MEEFDLFEDIAQRTGGDVYIGVVGPVRTGKSSFIKRFMELLVVPHISDENDRERTIDELPQSGAGRTVMTTEPKFVPDEAVAVPAGDISLRVRLVDSVGYPVEGAVGYTEEDGEPRMVYTPWFEEEIPFEKAAEVGTRKVIQDHSSIGIVVTGDGTVGELDRESFLEAEQRVVSELQDIGKPFVVVLNSSAPTATETVQLASALQEEYDVPVIPADVSSLTGEDLGAILEQVLYEFPVKDLVMNVPGWVAELPDDHWLKLHFDDARYDVQDTVNRLRDIETALNLLDEYEYVKDVKLTDLDLGTGEATVALTAPEGLFFQSLGDVAGEQVRSEGDIMRLMRQMASAQQQYQRVEQAMAGAQEAGYGISIPSLQDMTFEEPELIKKGNQFGVRLAAHAPSLHVMEVDVATEVTPMIGSEKQSRQLVQYLMQKFEDDPSKIWESDIFGKSLHELLREGIEDKLFDMPVNAQDKLQTTVQRICNEGGSGLICIII